jgi:hypothetical protein
MNTITGWWLAYGVSLITTVCTGSVLAAGFVVVSLVGFAVASKERAP